MGIDKLSRSQVSKMAKHLDADAQKFRSRPLDAGPYPYLWIDALVVKVREDGRTQNVSVMLACAVSRDGQREILGIDIDTAETGAGWLAFLRGLVAHGLSGVQLATNDAHGGLRAALVAALLALVEPDERGDPMSPLRWTTKSLRHLADELTIKTPASR